MRSETRKLFEEAIRAVTDVVKDELRSHMQQDQNVELTTTAFAWNVLQEAANRLKEELQSTPEGRMVLERGERARAGNKPS